MPQQVIIDTDTAGDDTQAILLACLTDRLRVEALTIVAGNVAFDEEVANALYTTSLAGREELPVYEGARQPLVKEWEFATGVHGEQGLGTHDRPAGTASSAEGFGPQEIVRRCGAAPGEISLLCIGPLTNVALALAAEPALPELVDEVWVMGGAVNCLGNVTPAAEFNFWVDPDAARRVLEAFDVTLVDWGLCVRAGGLEGDHLEAIADVDTPRAELLTGITERARAQARAERDVDRAVQPDPLAAALLAYPELREQTGEYAVTVDDREGLTRGYSSVDEQGVTDRPPRTRVIESADAAGFRAAMLAMVEHAEPDRAI